MGEVRNTNKKILFISLDTVCANKLSVLGATNVSTPNLDAMAAEGAVFTHAFTTDIPTQPSHTALFTGRYGASSGIVSHFHPPAVLAPETPWLPEMLRQRGAKTAAVDHLFSMKEWFIRGYDDYLVPPGRSRSPASQINQLAFPWFSEHVNDDFFCFLHFWDAHIPYVPPEPFRSQYTKKSSTWTDPQLLERLQARPSYPLFKQNHYDLIGDVPNLDYIADLHLAEIAYLDHEIGNLFNHLDSLGILDEMIVVVFGDHGEVMYEHESWFDHAGLYDSVVHVPLLIKAPGMIAPTKVDQLVALVDVFPTMLELLDMPEEPGINGHSLVPTLSGERAPQRAFVPLSECTWEAKRGIRTDRWKYIRSYDPGLYPCDPEELYDLEADPGETTNVADAYPEVQAELSRCLDQWLVDTLAGKPDPINDVLAEGLPGLERLKGLIAEEIAVNVAAS